MHRRLCGKRKPPKMGNVIKTGEATSSIGKPVDDINNFTPVEDFKFHDYFEEDTTDGLCFNNIYLPEEIVQNILLFVEVKDILKYSLVCKKWCNIIKSDRFWQEHYNHKEHPKKAKKWPWYILYSYLTTNNFKNLVNNGNGQLKFQHWRIVQNGGDRFTIENPPLGADPLPTGVPELDGYNGCFATSYGWCSKTQEIALSRKRLLQYIISNHRPEILVSEWTAGRFDCACIYRLAITGYNQDEIEIFAKDKTVTVDQFQGRAWEKVEILISNYASDLTMLVFEHGGKDRQFWKGHYGSKFAGGVVKFLLDSIEPQNDDCDDL